MGEEAEEEGTEEAGRGEAEEVWGGGWRARGVGGLAGAPSEAVDAEAGGDGALAEGEGQRHAGVAQKRSYLSSGSHSDVMS